MIKEFKEFAMKGNVVDLAVGVVIGAAFGKIVNSLVSDVIMPPIGWVLGGVNFTDIKIKLSEAVLDASGKVVTAGVSINIGNFIQAVFDFIIVAAAIFMLVRAMNKMKKAEAEAPAAPAAPSNEEVLLTQIRDLLKK
ncbi:MAG: large-conductance mechanosensitive channel protein MscL [Bacteroidetes bacterium]|nr:large-conductance mechanosensitive channel protein MscL [Bacteroidota bacterium]